MAVPSLREQRSATQGQSAPSLMEQRGGGSQSVAQQRFGVQPSAPTQAPVQQNTGYLPRWAYNTLDTLSNAFTRPTARVGLQAFRGVANTIAPGSVELKGVPQASAGQVTADIASTALMFLPFTAPGKAISGAVSGLKTFPARAAARGLETGIYGGGLTAAHQAGEGQPLDAGEIAKNALLSAALGVVTEGALSLLMKRGADKAVTIKTAKAIPQGQQGVVPKGTKVFGVEIDGSYPSHGTVTGILDNSITSQFGDISKIGKDGVLKTGIYSGMKILNEKGALMPEIAKGRIQDIAQQLYSTYPGQGVGERFVQLVNPNNVTIDGLRRAAFKATILPGQAATGVELSTGVQRQVAEEFRVRSEPAKINTVKPGDVVYNKDLGRFKVEAVEPTTAPGTQRIGVSIRVTDLADDAGRSLTFSQDEVAQLRKLVFEKPSAQQVTVPKVSAPQIPGAQGLDDLSIQGAARTAAEVDATIPGTNARSTAKQFPEQFEQVRQVEGGPGFTGQLAERGALEQKPIQQIIAEAKAVPEQQLVAIKQGEPVSREFLVGAHKTLENKLNSLSEKLSQVGKLPEGELSSLEQIAAGFKIASRESGRTLQVQSEFALTPRFAEGIENIARGARQLEGAKQKLFITRQLQELRIALNQGEGTPIYKNLRGLYDAVVEWSVAAKLTSPVTHIINAVSNTFTFVQRGVERVVSAGIAGARGRTSFVQELSVQAGFVNGFRAAGMKFSQNMRDMVAEVFGSAEARQAAIESLGRSAPKIDIRPQAIPGRFGAVVRLPFRFLQIADDFAKTILSQSELHRLAVRESYSLGLRGKALSEQAARFVQAPTDTMLVKAASAAKEFTFQTEPGKALQAIQTALNKIPGGRIVIPFIQTPTNIIKFYGQRSLLGIFAPRNLQDLAKSGISRDDAIARLTVGLFASLSTFAALYKNQDVTGDIPQTPAVRDKFYRDGKRPYSIKIKGQWIPYNRLQPVGLYISQMAAFRDAVERAKDKGEVEGAGLLITGAAVSFAKSLTEIPFVSGVSDAIDAINDPERSGPKFIQRAAAGFIPLWIRNVRLATDPTVRSPRSLSGAIQERIPGLSQNVPAKLDAFGREAQYPGGQAERLLVPSIRSPAVETPLEDELTDIEYTPGAAVPEIQGKELTAEQKRELSALLGKATLQAAQRIVQNPYYQALKDKEEKVKLLKKAIEVERRQVRRQYELNLR